MRETLYIGTRGSALALAQSQWVAAQVRTLLPGVDPELVVIKTSGDRFLDRPLYSIGGKGLFVKELEEALLTGRIDCAVHSLKDLPATLPTGLMLAAIPQREPSGDILLARDGRSLRQLQHGARVGTSSPRRSALLRWLRPDLNVVPLRGNVDTRIRRLREGLVDAIVLAEAALKRLQLAHAEGERLDPLLFLPAVGQGALAIETRRDHWAERLRALQHEPSAAEVAAERAFLATIGGSCHTPLGARGEVRQDSLVLHGFVADPGGAQVVRGWLRGPLQEAERLGAELARQLLGNGARRLLTQAAHLSG